MKFLFLLLLIGACNFEPKYQTPEPSVKLNEKKVEVVQGEWDKFFLNENLQKLIAQGIENNQDLKISVLNIERARAMFDLKNAEFKPNLNATASVTRQEAPAPFAIFTPKSIYRANINIPVYELDFFGRIRNASKAEYERYLASIEAKNFVQLSLITEIALLYVELSSQKESLKIAKKIEGVYKQKVNILQMKNEQGTASKTEVLNTWAEYEIARGQVKSHEELISVSENAILLLVGNFDKSPFLKTKFSEVKMNEKLLKNLPSSVLLSRYDIKQVEHRLISANADIGVARAVFFPSISITGNYGYFGRELSTLADSGSWALTPQFNLPIFDGGRNKINLRRSKIQKQILVQEYQKTIQLAFRESLDVLKTQKIVEEQVVIARKIANHRNDLFELVKLKNLNGMADKISVLNAQIQSLEAEKNTVLQEKERLKNLASIYKTFGGNLKG